MKNNEFESNDLKRIDQEAAGWVAKRIGGFPAKEQDAFFDWLAEDPRHGEWYERHRKTWKQLDLLAQWLPEHSDKPSQDLLEYHKPRSYWGWLGGIAAILLLGFMLLFTMVGSDHSDAIPTSLVADLYESHQLPDGSVVELNRGAALKIQFTKEIRLVELVSSEAHFTVTKDSDRPFIVRVRGIDIRAIGTAFNVRLTDQFVQVIVTEGRVEVAPLQRDTALEESASSSVPSFRHELVVGQMTELPLSSDLFLDEPVINPMVKEVSLSEMNQFLAWKPQMFEFDSTPLSEVIEELNRRNKTHIVIADANLRGMPIVASFRSADVEHFLELLQLSMDLEIKRDGKERIVLHSSH